MDKKNPTPDDAAEFPEDELLRSLEKPPFIGLRLRTVAFLGDCLVLFLVGKGLNAVARPLLLSLNPLLPYLGHLLALAYFWVGCGPWTEGRTLGKMLLGLHVVGADGQSLGPGTALRRALIQQACFLVLLAGFSNYLLIFPPSLFDIAAICFTLLSVIALSLTVALTFAILMHPRQRGWHDQWADSYVTRYPTPATFLQVLTAEPNPLEARRMALNLKMTLLIWICASAVLLIRPLKDISQPEAREQAQRFREVQQSVSMPNWAIMPPEFPNSRTRELFQEMVRLEHDRARKAASPTPTPTSATGNMPETTTTMTTATLAVNLPTTDTLRAIFVNDGESIVVQVLRRHGAVAPADLKDPAFRAALEQLRGKLWRQWQATMQANRVARAKDATTSATLPAQRFVAQIIEPLKILVYNHPQLRAKIYGPADPAAGALIFEEIVSLPPGSTTPMDHPTTRSTPVAGTKHEAVKP